MAMRVVVVGASGNVGTSLLRELADEPAVESVLGLSRRVPELDLPKVEWRAADICDAPLETLFADADAVVHLAWLIQPARDRALTRQVNVGGSERVFRAVAKAGVKTLVYASSVGAYARGPKDPPVDESWPTSGVGSSFYSSDKAAVEGLLDRFEQEKPGVRVVRFRPGLIFSREAASEIRRLFAGPFLPGSLIRPELVPLVPDVDRLVFQAVHSRDVGTAYRLALTGDARGAFNLAAEPVIGPAELGALMQARRIRVPARALRAAAELTFKVRLQPSEPGWLDMALAVPVMDTSRAREELQWAPVHSSVDALSELLAGIREGAGFETPPLQPGDGGPLRLRELLSGIGARRG